jgi:signal peptidase II
MSAEAPAPVPSIKIDPTSSGTSEPGAPGAVVTQSEALLADPSPDAAMTTEPEAPGAVAPQCEALLADPSPDAAMTTKVGAEPAVKPAAIPLPTSPPNYLFLGVVSLITLGFDLGSKIWAKDRLGDDKSFADRHIDFIPKLLELRLARNKGGGWGLLQEESELLLRPFFFSMSFLAVIFIVSRYRRLTPGQTAMKWGLPLVLGGALGNLVNRIQYNYVLDFIAVYTKWGGENHQWSTFNIADVAIVAGVSLMAFDMFNSRKPAKRAAVATADEAPRAL